MEPGSARGGRVRYRSVLGVVVAAVTQRAAAAAPPVLVIEPMPRTGLCRPSRAPVLDRQAGAGLARQRRQPRSAQFRDAAGLSR